MKTDKDFKPRTKVRVDGKYDGVILRKRCTGCGKTSIASYMIGKRTYEQCMNDCGPETLRRLLTF